MNEFKNRLEKYGYMKIHVFSRADMEQPIDLWQPCDTILTIHSRYAPKEKILEYIKLYKPQFLNDLESEWKIRSDRSFVSQILRQNNINVAR